MNDLTKNTFKVYSSNISQKLLFRLMDRFKDNNSPSSSFIFCGRGKSKLLFDTLVCSNGLSTAKKAIDCNELTN